ncbi:MAG: right-handed parallel beta-helix repeat-containing protein, partial [Planctomycetota bacterium]
MFKANLTVGIVLVLLLGMASLVKADCTEIAFEGTVRDTWIIDGQHMTAGRAALLYVDDDAAPGGDGFTWSTAFTHLRDARDYAFFHPEVDEIRVAGGTYYPDRNTAYPEGSGLRDWTFQLLNGVAFYGGYRGQAGGGDPDDRDLVAFESTLSGEIGDTEVTTDNSYHVVSGTGNNATALIDGFTITAGRADGSTPHDVGAGFINAGGSPALSNCTFTDNYASNDAGGMWYTGEEGADYVLTGCTFTGNYTVDDGGGMWFDNENEGGDLVLSGCIFTDNSCASSFPGAILTNWGTVTATGCTFSGNSGNGSGGGLTISTCGDAHVTDCSFSNNSTLHRGGGLHMPNSGTLFLTNCSFDGNSVS